MKSRKWSARHRNAQDRICRVWEERGANYVRLQREYEEAEKARQEKNQQRREREAAQVNGASYDTLLLLLYLLLLLLVVVPGRKDSHPGGPGPWGALNGPYGWLLTGKGLWERVIDRRFSPQQ